MIDFLYQIWDRLYTWFTNLYYKAYPVFSYYYSQLLDYLTNKYWYVVNVAYYWYNQLWYYRYVFITWAERIVNSLGYQITTFLNYYYIRLILFFNNLEYRIQYFIDTELPNIRRFINDYSYKLYLIAGYYYNNLIYLVSTAVNSIRDFFTNSYYKIINFVNNQLPQIIADVIPFIINYGYTIRTNIAKLQWLFDPKTFQTLVNLVNDPKQLTRLVIDDFILPQLNLFLTKLWYPHNPIDGEK